MVTSLQSFPAGTGSERIELGTLVAKPSLSLTLRGLAQRARLLVAGAESLMRPLQRSNEKPASVATFRWKGNTVRDADVYPAAFAIAGTRQRACPGPILPFCMKRLFRSGCEVVVDNGS